GAVTSYVKAVSVNGVEATVEHVKDETYPLSRPFVLAASAGENALRDDFLRFVCSADGQAIVADKGYIPAVKDAKPYVMTEVSGKLTMSGSTTVEKVMEKLKEAYVALHPNAVIELTYSGSSAGIKDATEGKVEIALSSRALKEEEKATLTETVFAHDGIAVIVHRDNPVTALTSEQITAIFTGAVRTWADRQE
ncbi:MAG: substrate-binding domain-containing protein, partial [Clostridia bacterium]